MHLVHRSTLNNSIIAVVGVLMKLVHEDNPNLNEIIEAATNLTEQGPIVLETLNLNNIINPSLDSLYFYKGKCFMYSSLPGTFILNLIFTW